MGNSILTSITSTIEKARKTRAGRAVLKVTNRLGLNDAVRRSLIRATASSVKDDPVTRDQIEDGILRLRITNVCNAKCRFCGLLTWSEEEQKRAMDPKWFYDYCKPLYEKLKIVLVTGGDAFVARESYNYMKFMSESYPRITLMTESNGVAFNERFRELACENLFLTCFSINASNAEVFQRGCWEGKAGEIAFNRSIENLRAYKSLLESRELAVFGPSLSMVINKDTAHDVLDFLRLALDLRARSVTFYFDYTESDMGGKSFGDPETSRPALRALMEVERVLARKFFVSFRLWIPTAEAAPLQAEVDATPLPVLREKHGDLLELAKDRSMDAEHQARNRLRSERGKKQMLFDEEWTPTMRQADIYGKKVCFAPWKEIDLYPDGRLDFCGWFRETLNLKSFIVDDTVDWDRILNSPEFKTYRHNMHNGCFDGCMSCCPMNSYANPVIPVHKYGYDRVETESIDS